MSNPILTKKYHFCASHKYGNDHWSVDKNLEVFGKDYNNHGHNYILEVSVTGPVNSDTGWLVDLGVLNKIVKTNVVNILDHAQIEEDIAWFKGKQPSSEVIVVWIWDQIAKDFKEAELYHRKAIEINPNFALAYVNLGNVLREMQKFQEAEIMLRKAIQIDPRSSIAHANLGDILKNKGQLAEAKILLRKAIEINPSLVKAFYSLSKLSFNSDDISWQKYLLSEKILEQKNEKDKIEIYFARSNVLHKEKRYDESAENLQIANQLKLKIYPSNIDTLINRSNLLLNKSNTGKNIKNEKQYPCSIFIVGMPRSGTTLVESIISLNEKVQDLGEINIFEKAYQESIKNDQELSLTDLYFQKIKELGINSSITTNKWLYNYLYAGIIANQISNSKIIHCSRNPLDNILSITRANFSTGNSYSSSLVDCTKVYLNQNNVMNIYKNLFSSSIYEMDYDLLVTNPESTIKSLINWLGWQWNENYLSPHKNQRTVLTASDVQIRSPINPKSIGGWKNYKNMLKPAISILSKTDQFKDLI